MSEVLVSLPVNQISRRYMFWSLWTDWTDFHNAPTTTSGSLAASWSRLEAVWCNKRAINRQEKKNKTRPTGGVWVGKVRTGQRGSNQDRGELSRTAAVGWGGAGVKCTCLICISWQLGVSDTLYNRGWRLVKGQAWAPPICSVAQEKKYLKSKHLSNFLHSALYNTGTLIKARLIIYWFIYF